MRYLANFLPTRILSSVASARRLDVTEAVKHPTALAVSSQISSSSLLPTVRLAETTWVEFEFPDVVADAMQSQGFPVMDGRVGVLLTPTGNGGTVRLFVEDAHGATVDLGFECGWVLDGLLQAFSEPTATTYVAMGGFVASFFRMAIVALHVVDLDMATAVAGRDFSKENVKRAKRGKPPLLTCETVSMRPGVGEAKTTHVGWYAVVNPDKGTRYVSQLRFGPETLRPMLDAMVRQAIDILDDKLAGEKAKLGWVLAQSEAPSSYGDVDPYAECVSRALGSKCFAVVLKPGGIDLNIFDEDGEILVSEEPPEVLTKWFAGLGHAGAATA